MNLPAPVPVMFRQIHCLVDETVGLVKRVEELPREAGAPAFFHYYAEACNTGAFCRQSNFSTSGGASTDRHAAMAKAIGEAIERYCSAVYDVNDLVLTSFKDASFRCIHPDSFALYSNDQYVQDNFPYTRFTDSTLVRWTPTADLLTEEIWHVPASMVFIPYFYNRELGEGQIAQPISTGLACHSTRAEAALSAICEVIERDAFMITWQATLGMPKIRIDTLSEQNRDLVKRFERVGSIITLFDLTMDHGIPTVQAVFRGCSSTAPAMVFAAATSLDPEVATRKSLEELAHTLRLAQRLKTHLPPFHPDALYSNVVDHLSHVHFYCNHANAKLADCIFSSPKHIDFQEIPNLSTGDPEKDLATLALKIDGIGQMVLLADLTTPDVTQVGLTVVRAIIPGCQPLFMGHRFRSLGGHRLWGVPQKLGYKAISRTSGDNPVPHPYP